MIGFDLVAIGRPYTDFILRDEDDRLIKRFGLRKGKASELSAERMALVLSDLPESLIHAGGSPPNTCAVVQALGGRAAFIGKVCDDKAGRIFREAFRVAGVFFATGWCAEAGASVSGACVILTAADGSETIVHCPGVGDQLTAADVLPNIIAQSQVLYVQAHLLFVEGSRFAIAAGIDVAQSAHRYVAFSLHDHQMSKRRADVFLNTHLGKAAMVLGNRQEFGEVFQTADLPSLRDEPWLSVITDGENGAYIQGRGEAFMVPAPTPRFIVNTIGAGDAFAGGFLFGFARRLSLKQCGEMAADAAGRILEQPSGRPRSNWADISRKYLDSEH